MYEYACKLIRVIDGDTVNVRVDLGFNVHIEAYFRFEGIDAPEIRGETKEQGLVVKKELEELFASGNVIVKTSKPDKYGRWLGTFTVIRADQQININEHLVNQGLAIKYP